MSDRIIVGDKSYTTEEYIEAKEAEIKLLLARAEAAEAGREEFRRRWEVTVGTLGEATILREAAEAGWAAANWLLSKIHGQALHHPEEDRELLRQRLRDISRWVEDAIERGEEK